MNLYRPRLRTRKDNNHHLPREWLQEHCADFAAAPAEVRGATLAYTAHHRGMEIVLYDMSAAGGIYPDYLLVVNGSAAWVEIKTPQAAASRRGGLTDGERWTQQYGGLRFFVVSCVEDFERLLLDFCQ